jgi:SAM-dependent methyltransferase
MDRVKFDRLVLEAEGNRVSGWDWGGIGDRYRESELPWDYTAIVRDHMEGVVRFLDMGTGGGEWLAELDDLPVDTWATEAWSPNVPIARANLEPLGVRVVAVEEDSLAELPDDYFDLVVNRHESFDACEVARVLRPGGVFLTQQVGGEDAREVNEALEDEVRLPYPEWGAELVSELLVDAGFEILESKSEQVDYEFADIGAVVFYLNATPWQVEGFSVASDRERLFVLHQRIEAEGGFRATMDRFLVVVRKPMD